jgi:broad-specificity NMP kinase
MVERLERKCLVDVDDDSQELIVRRVRKTAKSREKWKQKGSRFSEHRRKLE